MNYNCKDCSYIGKSSSGDGSCLACGSFNLARKSRSEEAQRPGRWRLMLLLALWTYLAGLILWKLND